MAQDVRKSGTIVKLMKDKGFGFIADDRGTEYFFHRSGVPAGWDEMVLSQAVTFRVVASPKGPRAEEVQVA